MSKYHIVGNLMSLLKFGIEEGIDKACPPSERMIFLGVLFNTITMTIEVHEKRLIEITPSLVFSYIVGSLYF